MQITKKEIMPILMSCTDEYFSATALWRLCGGDPKKKPIKYLRYDFAKSFIAQEYGIESELLEASEGSLNSDLPYRSVKGRNGGTYMKRALLIDYAQWLSPEIKSLVIETFLEFGQVMLAAPEAKTAILVEKAMESALPEKPKSEKETIDDKIERLRRVEAIATRKAFVSAIEVVAGVRMQDSPELCHFVARITDEIYRAFLGNSTKQLQHGLGLNKKSTPRDSLNTHYIYAISTTEQEILYYLQEKGSEANLQGVLDIIHEMADELCGGLLRRADRRQPAATNRRLRAGSGFKSGEYSARREEDSKILFSFTPAKALLGKS
jgi:hypothetical protein